MNAEPRIGEAQPMQSVAIVTQGGKKIGEDAQNMDPVKLIKPTSPKNAFRPDK